jgi:TRAP-type C4-dicarboxylate transport system permease large subunit
MLGYFGFGTLALVTYAVITISVIYFLRRPITEAMLAAYAAVLVIAAFAGHNPLRLLVEGVVSTTKQEAVYAAMTFVFMAYIMERTQIVVRLVQILNSLLGRLTGGAGYISTIASALFGMVSGSGTGNASTVGSITIPWMEETGWSKSRATSVVAGNAGLGVVFPPSSSMFLLLGMPAIAAELTSSQLYIALMGIALIVLAYRLVVIFYYVRKDKIKAMDRSGILLIRESLRKNWNSLSLFLGILIPLMLTIGPLSKWLISRQSFGAKGVGSISLLMWIPLLTTLICILTGWKYLPRSAKGWFDMSIKSLPRFKEIGGLMLVAFSASYALVKLGLEKEMGSTFSAMGQESKLWVVLAAAVLISMMVGPFTATATTTAVGSVVYLAFRGVGLSPVVAACAFLILVSNEGCIPPNSGPIYLASGISGLENPAVIFKPLIFHFAIPTVIIAVLFALGIISALS